MSDNRNSMSMNVSDKRSPDGESVNTSQKPAKKAKTSEEPDLSDSSDSSEGSTRAERAAAQSANGVDAPLIGSTFRENMFRDRFMANVSGTRTKFSCASRASIRQQSGIHTPFPSSESDNNGYSGILNPIAPPLNLNFEHYSDDQDDREDSGDYSDDSQEQDSSTEPMDIDSDDSSEGSSDDSSEGSSEDETPKTGWMLGNCIIC